jgi:enoyl-CoA hydratase/carnithine racemase
MSDINTERSGSILRVELNRPPKKNAITAAMYTGLAEIFGDPAKTKQSVSCSGTAPGEP